MKRQWEAFELIEHFTLLPSEQEILPSKGNTTVANQLGFAVLLKFFQREGRFPSQLHEVPKAIVSFIAKQLDIPYEQYLQYNWQGRTIKHHRAQIRGFMSTDSTLGDEQVHSKQSDFNNLKTDPGRTGLDSLLKEIDKLQCIRDLGLPSNLFANISPKVLHHYRQRASAEPPREFRRHPNSIRYTLVTAFCWQRCQEITDNLVELLVQIVQRTVC